MNKINSDQWAKFMLIELFNISNTKSITKKNVVFDSGDTPYVTASAENNGVLTHIACPKEWIDKGNCIVIGGKTLTFSYQVKDFCSNDSHNLALYMRDAGKATEIHYLFLISVLKASLRERYSWNDSISMKTIKEDYVYLPIDADGNLDWSFMSSFMEDVVLNESKKIINNLSTIDTVKSPLEINEWNRFHLYDDRLFSIDMGTKLDKSKMTDLNPTINFIGRSNNNNGITARVDEINGLAPYNTGDMTLSLGGEYLGSCFIQPDKFYVSQNVVVLKPRWNMPFHIKLFIATMIFCESRTYYKAFINELNRHIRTDFSFFLPVTLDGTPDWDYMNEYMSNIMCEANQKIENYRGL